jgi:NAD(P)-dependent dehydrogenase (short-subunit alcohol dehydrogenase family)
VVNNAGFAIPGDIELLKLSQYRRVMETNLFGQISIIKAFLPLLRQTKGLCSITLLPLILT